MQDQAELVKYLQTMIGTVADGGIGMLAKLQEYVEEHGLAKAIDNCIVARQSYYEKLSTLLLFW